MDDSRLYPTGWLKPEGPHYPDDGWWPEIEPVDEPRRPDFDGGYK